MRTNINTENAKIEVKLPQIIGDGRIDTVLFIFDLVYQYAHTKHKLSLNWSRVKQILPAGHAILICLADLAIEQRVVFQHKGLKKNIKTIPVIQRLCELNKFDNLSNLKTREWCDSQALIKTVDGKIDVMFIDLVKEKFGHVLNEDLEFSCRLILNELMQNSVDHSGAEKYYLYAGIDNDYFCFGVLDMGISIPSKLEQKYSADNDIEMLKNSLKLGVSTRRIREGGFGLYYTFDILKNKKGRMVILSRFAGIRRYFNNKKVQTMMLKHRLRGTWLFLRFSL